MWPGLVSRRAHVVRALNHVCTALYTCHCAAAPHALTARGLCVLVFTPTIAPSSDGVHYGSSCFAENDNSLYPTFGDGSVIPAHTPICPGAEFVSEGSVAGVQYFTYKCTGGDVINYGAPYK